MHHFIITLELKIIIPVQNSLSRQVPHPDHGGPSSPGTQKDSLPSSRITGATGNIFHPRHIWLFKPVSFLLIPFFFISMIATCPANLKLSICSKSYRTLFRLYYHQCSLIEFGIVPSDKNALPLYSLDKHSNKV